MKKKWRIFTVPNGITLIGMVCVFISAYLVYEKSYIEAFYFFLGVILSDYLDGLSARIIEKKWPGWGISRFGEVFDPVRDKSAIFILFAFNPTYTLFVVLAETLSTFYANKVRDVMRHHHIVYGSRVVTFTQSIIVCFLFFVMNWIDILIIVLAGLSFLRFLMYLLKYQSLTKKASVPIKY